MSYIKGYDTDLLESCLAHKDSIIYVSFDPKFLGFIAGKARDKDTVFVVQFSAKRLGKELALDYVDKCKELGYRFIEFECDRSLVELYKRFECEVVGSIEKENKYLVRRRL